MADRFSARRLRRFWRNARSSIFNCCWRRCNGVVVLESTTGLLLFLLVLLLLMLFELVFVALEVVDEVCGSRDHDDIDTPPPPPPPRIRDIASAIPSDLTSCGEEIIVSTSSSS